MEFIAAIAIGLNPYIGAFILAALAAFTPRGPETAVLEATPQAVLIGLAALCGLVAPVDFILGKFVRFAPRVRRASQVVAPIGGGLASVAVSQTELPLPLVFAGGAAISWSVAALISTLAARGSRSRAWAGLGHVPILMAAATAAACIVPLALANTTLGMILALGTLVTLLAGSIVPGLVGGRSAAGGRVTAGRGLASRRVERVGVQVNV